MKRVVFCASALLALVACSGAPESTPEAEAEGSVSQSLASPASVLGFENPSEWTSTQGVKTSSPTASQGAASLAVSGFSYTAVISAPLATLSGVTSTLAFDVRLPAALPWGQVQLSYSIPSRNIYERQLGQASLAGLAAGAFQTLSFAVPASLQQELGTSYDDLKLKIGLSVPQSSQSILLDNLRFVTSTIQASRIEIEVTTIDDAVVALVDGVRRGSWSINDPRLNTRVDVSSWFTSGTHSLRLLAANTGGPAQYGVRVWADDALVFESFCSPSVCNGQNRPAAFELDKTLQFSTPTRPPAQTVQLTSAAPGKVYLDNAFTGLTTTGTSTPVTLSLPPGNYSLGLGTSTDAPPSYSGLYREQQVTVGTAPVSVNLSAAPALGVQDTTSIVVVPIRRTVYDPHGTTGTLTDEDITAFQAQTEATRANWLVPFSYGLNDWNVTWHPTVENVPVHVRAASRGIDTDAFLCEAGLTSLRSSYDLVVYFWNTYDDAGAILGGAGGVDYSGYGGGGQVWLNTFWTRRSDWPHLGPNPALLHEVLHNYEQYNAGVLRNYNGIQELHGAEPHGYPHGAGGELDFARWMRSYIRGQVGELATTHEGQFFSEPLPAPELWNGVFDTIRRGYQPSPWSAWCPASVGAKAAFSQSIASQPEDVIRCPAPQ